MYAINPNGTLKWNLSFNDDLGSIVIGSDGTIYAPGDKLYAINPDGTIKWTYDHQCSSLSIGPDGTIYMVYTLRYRVNGKWVNDIGLHALNPDGAFKWNSTVNSTISGTPAVASDGILYLLSGGNLIAINSTDGSRKLNYTAGGSCYSSPVIGADGTIYFTTSNGIFAINSLGELKWNYTGISTTSNPIIDSDGTLYVETSKGLFAFRDAAAKFNYTIGSNPLYVEFNDTSNNATSWKWNFGDGTSSTEQNPVHTYSKSGQYTVTLTATLNNGETLTAAQMITISDVTPPTITISPNGGNFDTNQTIILNATDDSDNLIVYYTTDGSDPQTSSTRHIYSASITISNTTTLDYAAVDSSGNWTPVYEEIYTKSEVISSIIINVTSSMTNDQIQSILNNAAPGNTIEFIGTDYKNLHLTINKQLNIISNVGTKITSSNTSAVFTINGTQASGTTIKGFTIVNTGTGILINNTDNVTISNDMISSTGGTAILINKSSNTTIRSSTIHDSVTGISVSGSTCTQINRNNIYSNKIGINIKNSENTSTSKNQITYNTENGIYVKNSKNITINSNTVKKNGNIANSGSGIYLEDSTDINVNNNQINENCNGLTAYSLTNVLISNNKFLNNDRDGMTLNGVMKNTTLLNNTAQQNNVGIRIDCRSENLTVRANLVTGNIKKSKTLQYSGSGILLGNNYVNSPTFLVEHNVLLSNADMDFRSCAAAGNHLTGSNWFRSGCKQVTYDPQMSVVLIRTGENKFTMQIYDGRTGELVTDLPSLPATFIMGAYSQMINTNQGSATATFESMSLRGQVIVSIFGYQVAIDYNTPITPLNQGSNSDNPNSGGNDNPNSGGNSGNNGTGSGNEGDGPGSGSGNNPGTSSNSGTSGSSSSNGASSGSSASVGLATAAADAGSSGNSGQAGFNGQQSGQSKTAQELFIDDTTKNTQFWGILGVIVLLVVIFGGYYRKDLMSMIRKSKK